jgi:hypothetical protein
VIYLSSPTEVILDKKSKDLMNILNLKVFFRGGVILEKELRGKGIFL